MIRSTASPDVTELRESSTIEPVRHAKPQARGRHEGVVADLQDLAVVVERYKRIVLSSATACQ